MNEPIPDDDLKGLFARQRAVDHESAPTFHAMRTRALATEATARRPEQALGWRRLLPAGATLALAVVVLLATHHPTAPPAPPRDALARQLEEIDAALLRSAAAQHELTAWQSPTDFLLHPTHNENRP